MLTEKSYKADISFSTSGDQTIISAPGDGKYLAIDQINFVVAGATNIQFKDGSTNYGGAYPLTTNQAVVLENSYMHDHGVITGSNNSAFKINSSAAVQVSGFVRYRLVGGM